MPGQSLPELTLFRRTHAAAGAYRTAPSSLASAAAIYLSRMLRRAWKSRAKSTRSRKVTRSLACRAVCVGCRSVPGSTQKRERERVDTRLLFRRGILDSRSRNPFIDFRYTSTATAGCTSPRDAPRALKVISRIRTNETKRAGKAAVAHTDMGINLLTLLWTRRRRWDAKNVSLVNFIY